MHLPRPYYLHMTYVSADSIISTHDECCERLVQTDLSFHACITVLKKYPGANNIVVRMGYALGNLMARSESARVKVSHWRESRNAPHGGKQLVS